ncbi:hypothetical protein [Longispora urticae]
MIVGSLLLILVAAVLVVVGLIQASNVLLISAIVLCGVAAVLVYRGSRQPITAPTTAPRATLAAPGRVSDTPPVDLSGESVDEALPDRYAERVRRAERLAAAEVAHPDWFGSRPGDAGDASQDDADAPPGHIGTTAVLSSAGSVTHGDDLDAHRTEAVDHGSDSTPHTAPPAEPVSAPPPGHLGGSAFAGPANRAAADGDDELEYEDDDPEDEPPAQDVAPAVASRIGRLTTRVWVVDGRPRYHLSGCHHLVGRDPEPLPVGEAQALGFSPCGLCEPATTLGGRS